MNSVRQRGRKEASRATRGSGRGAAAGCPAGGVFPLFGVGCARRSMSEPRRRQEVRVQAPGIGRTPVVADDEIEL